MKSEAKFGPLTRSVGPWTYKKNSVNIAASFIPFHPHPIPALIHEQ